MSLPWKTVLWGGGAIIALVGGGRIAFGLWRYASLRKYRHRRIEDWTALARASGFELDTSAEEVALRGTVASRSVVVDGGNFFGYGVDWENAMHFPFEDEEARFAISTWGFGLSDGLRHPPVGDAAFDARYHVHANEAGLPYVARLGPDERRILLRTSELCLFQSRGRALIRLPYRLDGAHLDDACELVTRIWGPLSSLSRPGNADPART